MFTIKIIRLFNLFSVDWSVMRLVLRAPHVEHTVIAPGQHQTIL
jgi:hypothetical protein